MGIRCTYHELTKGKILFDPKKDKNLSRDHYHLALIQNYCSRFDIQFLKKTKRWKEFFDCKGNLKDFKLNLQKDKLFHIPIVNQLCIPNPKKRPSSKTLLEKTNK